MRTKGFLQKVYEIFGSEMPLDKRDVPLATELHPPGLPTFQIRDKVLNPDSYDKCEKSKV